MLLAVAPPRYQRWESKVIEQILIDILDLSKLRTVDFDSMRELQHYLQALYFALNAEEQTITTNFGTA